MSVLIQKKSEGEALLTQGRFDLVRDLRGRLASSIVQDISRPVFSAGSSLEFVGTPISLASRGSGFCDGLATRGPVEVDSKVPIVCRKAAVHPIQPGGLATASFENSAVTTVSGHLPVRSVTDPVFYFGEPKSLSGLADGVKGTLIAPYQTPTCLRVGATPDVGTVFNSQLAGVSSEPCFRMGVETGGSQRPKEVPQRVEFDDGIKALADEIVGYVIEKKHGPVAGDVAGFFLETTENLGKGQSLVKSVGSAGAGVIVARIYPPLALANAVATTGISLQSGVNRMRELCEMNHPPHPLEETSQCESADEMQGLIDGLEVVQSVFNAAVAVVETVGRNLGAADPGSAALVSRNTVYRDEMERAYEGKNASLGRGEQAEDEHSVEALNILRSMH